jgi:hypothetical protein
MRRVFTTDDTARQSRNHREDGGWKSREKSQGNVCQGNNPENAFSHSLDKLFCPAKKAEIFVPHPLGAAERRGEETVPHAELKKGLKRHALPH